jgi:hypothetical protein
MVTFAPLDPERLTRRYHRRWHARHGFYAAAMRLEEATDERGRLRGEPAQAPRLLGAPGHVWASAARHATKWALAAARREWARAAHHEHRVRYLLTYVRRTAALTRRSRPGLLAEAAAFGATHLERRARGSNMSPARLVVAHAIIALLVAGSAYDIATGREHWPLSPYPMFSSAEESRTLDSLIVRGVEDDGSGRELALREAAFIAPFDQCRITTALQRAASMTDGGGRLHAMLSDTLARYEAARESGAHDGPPLRAIRLYRAHWTLRPDGSNVDRPDRATLVDEASIARSLR